MGRWLKKSQDAPSTALTKLTEPGFVGFVSTLPGAYEKKPAAADAPCPSCGGGYYYRPEPAASWHCHTCTPPTTAPAATCTVPGGRLPEREPQDIDAVLAAAVDGLALAVDQLVAELDPADPALIASGHLSAEYLHRYAQTLAPAARMTPKPKPVERVTCESCASFSPGETAASIGACAIPEAERSRQDKPLWALVDRICNRWTAA